MYMGLLRDRISVFLNRMRLLLHMLRRTSACFDSIDTVALCSCGRRRKSASYSLNAVQSKSCDMF